MRLLVDTHLLLWAAAKSRRLPKEARRLLEDPANDVLFSAASLWEIAIKAALRKPDFNVDIALLRGPGPRRASRPPHERRQCSPTMATS